MTPLAVGIDVPSVPLQALYLAEVLESVATAPPLLRIGPLLVAFEPQSILVGSAFMARATPCLIAGVNSYGSASPDPRPSRASYP